MSVQLVEKGRESEKYDVVRAKGVLGTHVEVKSEICKPSRSQAKRASTVERRVLMGAVAVARARLDVDSAAILTIAVESDVLAALS